MQKICKNCNLEFETETKRSFCSQSCANKYRWNDILFRNKMIKVFNDPDKRKANSERQKIAQNKVEVKEKISKKAKEYWAKEENRIKQSIKQYEVQNRPEVKAAARIKNKEVQNRPEVKAATSLKAKETNNRPDVKEKISKGNKRRWSNIEYRNKMRIIHQEVQNRPDIKKARSVFMKEYANRAEIRKKRSDDAIKRNNNPDVKLAKSKASREHWSDPERAEKHLNACFKYKEYIMPSGKIVKIQGYEPQVLTELLKTYTEEDIVIGVKEMNKEIGRIKYTYENKERTYYPDFYIKSTNTIIEVKSTWTYEIHKEKNLIKKQTCLDLGFNFEFKIIKK